MSHENISSRESTPVCSINRYLVRAAPIIRYESHDPVPSNRARVPIQRSNESRFVPIRFDFYPFSSTGEIIACIRSIKQGERERERKIDKYSCRKTQGLRSFTCLLIRHVNRYSTMIHGKLCHARVRYINFLNVPCIRKKTREPGKIRLSGN